MPSTTVVVSMLHGFHTLYGGWNHGGEAGARPIPRRRGSRDGAHLDAVADRGGTSERAPVCAAGSPVARVGVSPGLAQSRGAEKRLAARRSQRRHHPVWGPTFLGTG